MIHSLILAMVTAFTVQNTDFQPQALNWKVGDKADYSLEIGGFLKGTMNMLVREETAQGFWVNQDADLGFAGKQKIEILFDKNSGAILEMRVNGEKQTPPDPADMEIVETKQESVTVPAGTFQSLYIKLKDNKNNQMTEAWLNPEVVPIAGNLKTLSDTQFGKMKMLLTAYKKN
jgi:hypothetical protein